MTIAAYTTLAPIYPGYVNVRREDGGSVIITVRGDPTVRDGEYICGRASDKGAHGRCTPGDDHCNNYCNMAPQKGPMQDHPLPCQQTLCGETVTLRLTSAEWADLLRDLSSERE